MRCPECASLRSSHLYQVQPHRLLLAAFLGVIAGIIGAQVLYYVGFFVFLIGPAYGYGVSEVVLFATGRKRGRMIEAIGVGSIVVGSLIVMGVPAVIMAVASSHAKELSPYMPYLLSGAFRIIWPLVGVALAISTCFSKLRYF